MRCSALVKPEIRVSGQLLGALTEQQRVSSMRNQASTLAALGRVLIAVLLVIGYRIRTMALIIAAFTVAAAQTIRHDFADQNQATHFLNNIAVIGGLLEVAVHGAGSSSLDAADCALPGNAGRPMRWESIS